MKIRYFDHAATTAVRKEVLEEMLPYFHNNFGNPSSLYGIGRENKRVIEKCREKIAGIINCKPKEIYFTSCGSESDNLAIKGIAYANKEKGMHIITSKIEHPAVLNTCKTLEKEGFEITYLDVNEDGIISINDLENNIREDTILITIMFANNEIGSIQPIREIGNIARSRKIVFHTDSVQTIGNEKINVEEMQIDALSMSAHKFYGPKGIGSLFVKDGINFNKIQDGGHQERNKRAGTENIAGIVGIAKAIEIADKNLYIYNNKLSEYRNYFLYKIKSKYKDIRINGGMENRLCGNINVGFKNIDGEELMMKLDEVGICVSTGSACSSGNPEPSHVLKAINCPDEFIQNSIRITFGEENTKDDVDYLINSIIKLISKTR